MLEKIIICFFHSRILLLEIGGKYTNVIESTTLNLDDLAQLINLNKVKTYILLSPETQKFITKSFPFISYANIKSLVQLVNMESRGFNYNTSEYFFVSSRENKFYYSFVFDNLSGDLLSFIEKIQDTFQGVYFNSLESHHILPEIFSHTLHSRNDYLLLLYTHPNHIMIIRADENLITTQISVRQLIHNTKSSIAGEILQIVDDLITKDGSANIAIITPNDIKTVISQERSDRIMVLLSPYEAAIILKIEHIIKSEEEFADLIFIRNIALNRKSFPVFPAALKEKITNRRYSRILNYVILGVAFLCVVVFIFFSNELKTKTLVDQTLSTELDSVQRKFTELSAELNHYSSQSQEKINLYKVFDSADFSVLERVKKFNEALDIEMLRLRLGDEMQIESVDIQIYGKPKLNIENAQNAIQNEYASYKTSFHTHNDSLQVKIEK